MPGYLTQRVVHVHPLLLCNLKCVHCYSSSAPGLRASLPADRLVTALEVLRGVGYAAVSISGGEPFLYRELDRLTEGSKAAGYSVNVITNGTVLSRKHLTSTLSLFDFVAVSIDGSPANHDRIRASDGAFARAERGIDLLAESGVPYGITFCVTSTTLEDVPWVHDFARRKGARLLNLRPLAPIGRGSTMAVPEALTSSDQARLFLIAELLDGSEVDGPRVRVDLVPVARVVENKLEAFPVLDRASPMDVRLSDWVNPLIVDERGRVLPFAYGMSNSYAIGDVYGDVERWVQMDPVNARAIRELLEAAFDDLESSDRVLVDWFEFVTATSHQLADRVGASDALG